MQSPRGLLMLGLSVAAIIAAGPPSRARAQQAKTPLAPQPVAVAQPKAPAPAQAPVVAEPARTPAPTAPSATGPANQRTNIPAPVADQPPLSAGQTPTPVGAPPPAHPSGAGGDAMAAPGAASATAAPAGMPRGPSIFETGRVGKMGVSDSGVKIKHTTQDASRPKEQQVQGQPSRTERAAPDGPPARGALDQAALGRELRPRLALLRDCRVEVARQKHVAAKEVTAGRLILRWIIHPSGQVSDTQVVALSPVDGRVIDCVKREMSIWSFTPPTGGPARVERPFKF